VEDAGQAVGYHPTREEAREGVDLGEGLVKALRR
jgi:hypothetical protein